MSQDGPRFYNAYQLHKSIGILILLLTLVRVVQRLAMQRPAPLEGGWAGRLAHWGHIGLYAFMVAAPLTGWLLVSTAAIRVPTLLFGILPWPHLPISQALHGISKNAHEVFAWIGAALIVAHLAGAARHVLILRDGLLWRIVPARSSALATMLIAMVGSAAIAGIALPRALGSKSTAMAATQPPSPVMSTPLRAAEPALPDPSTAADPVANIATPEAVEAPVADQPAPVQPADWYILPGKSLRFSVGIDGGGLDGRFGEWSGTIRMDPDNPQTAQIDIDIDLSSLTMDDATQRDTALGDGFLNASRNSRATFRSTAVRRTDGNRYTATGTLVLNGTSKPQTIAFTLSGSGDKRRVTGSGRIAREAFGVGTQDIGFTLAPEVAIDFAFDAERRSLPATR